ncbi:MAG: GtrA family protein [archaeon]|nr:GtrA family protein [archaeon]MDD2477633.1 GtrA family protein [Candidatus ainarchaeum sp.]MDD3084272.1 GtrA family protein [Candidatus ainarchaeum sp.]MDD4221013.1 GtrA family protein [Candidatus ainarchaeum sp.]MDD4662485.1 GtrA family protein [Candidatus ainarchaeum sp.]
MGKNYLDRVFDFLETKNKNFRNLRKFGKYSFFSVVATITDIIILFILTEFIGIYYLLSVKISYVGGMLVAFFGNKKYTFDKNKKKNLHKFIDFVIISVIDLMLNIILIKILTEYFSVWYIFSKIIVVFIIFIAKYYTHKKIAFNN